MTHKPQIDTQQQTITAFDQAAEQYESSIAKLTNYNPTYDFLLSLLKQNDQILDLACGPANISQYLKNKLPLQITGYDLSEKMLSIAQRNIQDGHFEKQSICDFTYPQQAHAIINGFGLPYLSKEQIKPCFKRCHESLVTGGIMYISFMQGSTQGYEIPSFDINAALYIYYHQLHEIIAMLKNTGFTVIKKWQLDYIETDGSKTQDIVLICTKQPPMSAQ